MLMKHRFFFAVYTDTLIFAIVLTGGQAIYTAQPFAAFYT